MPMQQPISGTVNGAAGNHETVTSTPCSADTELAHKEKQMQEVVEMFTAIQASLRPDHPLQVHVDRALAFFSSKDLTDYFECRNIDAGMSFHGNEKFKDFLDSMRELAQYLNADGVAQ